MSQMTDDALMAETNRGGRPRIPDADRLVPMTIFLQPDIYDDAVRLALLHDIPLSKYGRLIVTREVRRAIDDK